VYKIWIFLCELKIANPLPNNDGIHKLFEVIVHLILFMYMWIKYVLCILTSLLYQVFSMRWQHTFGFEWLLCSFLISIILSYFTLYLIIVLAVLFFFLSQNWFNYFKISQCWSLYQFFIFKNNSLTYFK
jgi:hypothetical protein